MHNLLDEVFKGCISDSFRPAPNVAFAPFVPHLDPCEHWLSEGDLPCDTN